MLSFAFKSAPAPPPADWRGGRADDDLPRLAFRVGGPIDAETYAAGFRAVAVHLHPEGIAAWLATRAATPMVGAVADGA